MDADEHLLLAGYVPAHECNVVLTVRVRAVEVQVEVAVIGRHFHDLDAFDELLAGAAVADEIGDGADLELVFAGELP